MPDTMKVFNPAAPDELVAEIRATSPDGLPEIIAGARAAFDVWRKVPMAERAVKLEAFLDAILTSIDEIALSIAQEQGKPLREARAETMKSVAEARAMVAHAMTVGTASAATRSRRSEPRAISSPWPRIPKPVTSVIAWTASFPARSMPILFSKVAVAISSS